MFYVTQRITFLHQRSPLGYVGVVTSTYKRLVWTIQPSAEWYALPQV